MAVKSIFIYVQHLLGTGHLFRIAEIANSLSKAGFTVTLASGGSPVKQIQYENCQIIQLPVIKSDPNFSTLTDENGIEITDSFKKLRINLLIEAFDHANAQMLLIETYPFGRRQMQFELRPLICHVKNKKNTAIACSIRDIVQPKSKASRNQEIVDIINSAFDFVFVHGDVKFIKFDQSFKLTPQIKKKIIYTGYVNRCQPSSKDIVRANNLITVSAGGGSVGMQLYKLSLACAKQPFGKAFHWQILVGPGLSESRFLSLTKHGLDNVTLQRNRSDFTDVLLQSTLSISQAGYNTVLDLLMTNTQSILIPFVGENEREQTIRATILNRYKQFEIIDEKSLSIENLIKAIKISMKNHADSQQDFPNIRLDGADFLANFLKTL